MNGQRVIDLGRDVTPGSCYLQSMKTSIAIVAALLAIAGNVPYLRDIIQKKVKPHPYTWLVWTIVSCIVFFGQVARGAGIGALSTAASEIFTVIIFLLSLKYGFKNIRRIDTYCLIIALVGHYSLAIDQRPNHFRGHRCQHRPLCVFFDSQEDMEGAKDRDSNAIWHERAAPYRDAVFI